MRACVRVRVWACVCRNPTETPATKGSSVCDLCDLCVVQGGVAGRYLRWTRIERWLEGNKSCAIKLPTHPPTEAPIFAVVCWLAWACSQAPVSFQIMLPLASILPGGRESDSGRQKTSVMGRRVRAVSTATIGCGVKLAEWTTD